MSTKTTTIESTDTPSKTNWGLIIVICFIIFIIIFIIVCYLIYNETTKVNKAITPVIADADSTIKSIKTAADSLNSFIEEVHSDYQSLPSPGLLPNINNAAKGIANVTTDAQFIYSTVIAPCLISPSTCPLLNRGSGSSTLSSTGYLETAQDQSHGLAPIYHPHNSGIPPPPINPNSGYLQMPSQQGRQPMTPAHHQQQSGYAPPQSINPYPNNNYLQSAIQNGRHSMTPGHHQQQSGYAPPPPINSPVNPNNPYPNTSGQPFSPINGYLQRSNKLPPVNPPPPPPVNPNGYPPSPYSPVSGSNYPTGGNYY
jgi:hypothetical protein